MRIIDSSDIYIQPSWSSHATYGARIKWSDGTHSCCGHSHKKPSLAERCLAKWIDETQKGVTK